LEPSRQRWFFGGKLLGDKMHIEEAKVQPGYIIQVIVNPEKSDNISGKASWTDDMHKHITSMFQSVINNKQTFTLVNKTC